MLDREEKKEFMEDARSQKRKKNFAKARMGNRMESGSLDAYIRFLMATQEIFPPFANSNSKTITALNKL